MNQFFFFEQQNLHITMILATNRIFENFSQKWNFAYKDDGQLCMKVRDYRCNFFYYNEYSFHQVFLYRVCLRKKMKLQIVIKSMEKRTRSCCSTSIVLFRYIIVWGIWKFDYHYLPAAISFNLLLCLSFWFSSVDPIRSVKCYEAQSDLCSTNLAMKSHYCYFLTLIRLLLSSITFTKACGWRTTACQRNFRLCICFSSAVTISWILWDSVTLWSSFSFFSVGNFAKFRSLLFKLWL